MRIDIGDKPPLEIAGLIARLVDTCDDLIGMASPVVPCLSDIAAAQIHRLWEDGSFQRIHDGTVFEIPYPLNLGCHGEAIPPLSPRINSQIEVKVLLLRKTHEHELVTVSDHVHIGRIWKIPIDIVPIKSPIVERAGVMVPNRCAINQKKRP